MYTFSLIWRDNQAKIKSANERKWPESENRRRSAAMKGEDVGVGRGEWGELGDCLHLKHNTWSLESLLPPVILALGHSGKRVATSVRLGWVCLDLPWLRMRRTPCMNVQECQEVHLIWVNIYNEFGKIRTIYVSDFSNHNYVKSQSFKEEKAQ